MPPKSDLQKRPPKKCPDGAQWCSRQLHPHYYENVQLYDLESDPKELVNVAASHADRVAELSRLLEGHMARALSE